MTDGNGKSHLTWAKLYTTVRVRCSVDRPVGIEFVPAKGFKLQGYVGHNYIDESIFYGEGNAFELPYEHKIGENYGDDTITPTYTFEYTRTKKGNDIVEGFFADIDEMGVVQLDPMEELMEVYLKKGANKVTIPYTAYVEGQKDPIKLSFTVTIYANKYYTYANYPVFNYTGKSVSKKAFAKKLVVRDSSGRKIPASAYTFKWRKHKKMGWYTVTIHFKDKNKYEDPLIVSYGIGPKKPKITNVRGGKKQLTVTWKTFTKSQLKKIDGMYIDVAMDKNFIQGFKRIKVTRKALRKSNTKTIKKLTGGKKYYVRMYTYKKIKQNGVSFIMDSEDSKIKTGKTRK